MLHLKDKTKKKIAGLVDYKDLYIEKILESGDQLLSFLYPKKSKYYFDIEEECYINTKENEFIVKEKNVGSEYTTFKCVLNLEDLEGKPWERYESVEQTIDKALALALAGTGWIVGKCTLKKKRTVRATNCSSLEVIKNIRKTYRCDLVFNTLTRTIDVCEHLGEDKGTYFIDSLNLKELSIQGNSYDFFTRIIPIGKDNLRISSINDGKEYVENYQYSNKIKTIYWKDDRYTIVENLKEDAEAKLDEISKPYRAYSANILNLAKLNDKYKDILDYKLGDTITLISKDNKFRDKQRIVKIIEHPDEHEKDSVELANTTLSFEEMQTQFQEAADTVDNITTDNGTVDGSTINSIKTEQISDFETSVAKITDLTVVNAKIENLEAFNVSITGRLTAVEADIGALNANIGVIDKLTVTHTAQINNLIATKADITDLNAVNATIQVLEAHAAKIETLVNGNLSSENIQTGGITGNSLNMKTIFVDDANIVSVNASKIHAGEIDTNKVKIKSDDGGIEIVGATQQFKDKNNRVRIQMGKDAQGNFNFIILGEDGTSTLIDHTGVKPKAIADDLIVSNMIASDAVGEKQINYSSFANGFNKDTNATTLKATKIRLDNQNQTLDMAFNSLQTEVQGIQVGVRNLALKSNHPRFNPNNVGLGTSVLVSDKTGDYYRATPDAGKSISLYYYCKDSNVSKELILDGKTPYCISLEVRVSRDSNITRFNFEGNKSEIITLKANTWTRIKAENIIIATNSNRALILALDNQPDLTLDYRFFKLEEGTKTSNWTPAPEDSERDISKLKEITTSQSTTIGVMQGQISTAINNTQIVKDGQTILLKDDYNRTVATVDSMKSTIGSHTTKINEQTGKINNVETKVNTVERDLNSITARVSSTETNITTIREAANNANTKIDNLKIGGRNLVLKSNEFDVGSSGQGITSSIEPNGSLKVVTTLGNENWHTQWYKTTSGINEKLNDGDIFTISFTIKSPDTTNIPDIYIKSGMGYYTMSGKIGQEYSTIYYTGVWKSSNPLTPHLGWAKAIGTYYIKDWKIEKGSKPSDWTPAPEDVQTEITTTKNKISIIETNLSSITSRVSSVETTNANINGQVSNLSTRMNAAEQKITDSSIISIVSKQFYSKGEADTRYASQTQISQLDNKITSKVETIENWKQSDTNRVINSKIYQSSNAYGFGYRDVMFERGKQYSFTVNGRVSQQALNDGKKLAVFIYNDDWTWSKVLYIDSLENTNAYITFTAPDNGLHRIQSYLYPNGGSRAGEVTANWYKCVEGNRPSIAWSPAPEDINGRVDKQQSEIVQLSSQISTKVDVNGVISIIQQNSNAVNIAFNNINPNVQHTPGMFTIRNGKFEMFDNTNSKIMYVNETGLISSTKGYATYNPDQSGLHFLGNIIYHVPNKSDNYDNMYIESNKPIKFKIARSWDGIQGKDYQQIITSGVQLDGKAWDPSGIQGYILAADYELDTVVLYNQYKGLQMNIKARNAEFAQLTCSGAKNRIVDTKNYGTRRLNAVETCECYFEDRGRGKIKNGKCIIEIDPIFAETVNLNDYDVSISKYGKGDLWISERTKTYFVVEGDNDIKFSYILYAKQLNYENHRLEIYKETKMSEVDKILIKNNLNLDMLKDKNEFWKIYEK